jgi:thioredoxin-like negative regulator of GroEL
MNPVLRVLTAVMGTIVLLGILSLTVFNKHAPHMRMRALMWEGRNAMEEGDYADAAEAYRHAVALRPKNVNAYILLANACIKDDEFEEALYFLRLGMDKTGNEKIRIAINDLLGAIAVREEQEAEAAAKAQAENND